MGRYPVIILLIMASVGSVNRSIANDLTPVEDLDRGLQRSLTVPREAGATGCSAVNLRSQLPPVRDQGQRGFCFAFVAADLLSERMGIQGGVSAYQVTANYFLNGLDRETVGRFGSHFASHFARPQRSARVSHAALRRDETARFHSTYRRGLEGFENVGGGHVRGAILDFANAKKVCSENEIPYSSVIDRNGTDRMLAASRQRFIESRECELRSNSFLNSANNIYAALSMNAHGLIDDIETQCRSQVSRRRFIPQSFDSSWPTVDQRSSRAVHRALDLRRPAGISLDMRSWMSPVPEGHAYHAMVIVGREWDAARGQCRFRVWNSWGATCSLPYSRRVQCDRDGTLLVDGDLLNETVQSVNYIP
jgi:hypothetical protein